MAAGGCNGPPAFDPLGSVVRGAFTSISSSRSSFPAWLNWFMVTVGIIFVVNSLDSLIRLYGLNLGWTKSRIGREHTIRCTSFFSSAW